MKYKIISIILLISFCCILNTNIVTADEFALYNDTGVIGTYNITANSLIYLSAFGSNFSTGYTNFFMIAGDWDGDGLDEPVLYDKTLNNFILMNNTIQNDKNHIIINLGWPGVIPIMGDWNADGKDDIGVFDPTTATWAFGDPTNPIIIQFGPPQTSVPIVGDWDEDGNTDIGVFSEGTFFLDTNRGVISLGFNWKNGFPVVGNWDTKIIQPPQPQQYYKPTIMSYSDYERGNSLYVVGEIQNFLNTNIEFVKVVVTYYDSNNEIVTSDFTYTDVSEIKPGQKSPFKVITENNPNIASYDIQATYRETNENPYNGLEIVSSRENTIYSSYGIVGEVVNNGIQDAQYVKIIATYYDANNQVIDTDFTYTTIDILSPGAKSPFQIISYGMENKPARYELQVQGRATIF